VELAHWFTASAPASGSLYMDNIFFRALPSPASSDWTTLIPFGAAWRYSITTPVANWFLPAFNDLSWLNGTAKFGTGGGPTNVVTALTPQKPAYYFRRTFVLPTTPCEELLLAATCTDAGLPLEIYLNGTKLPTTGIEATTGQGNEVQYYDLAPFLNLLHPGENTIAVTLSNTFSSWDDVAFDISLKTITRATDQTSLNISSPTAPDTGGGTSAIIAPPQMNLTVTVPSGTIWRVESADALTLPWQLMDIVTNNSAGPISIQDYGQNGRLPSSSVSSRFYRMIPN
jgi:hypothetical protein